MKMRAAKVRVVNYDTARIGKCGLGTIFANQLKSRKEPKAVGMVATQKHYTPS